MSEIRGAGAGAARLHSLDALRSLLMLFGVLLHAADPYAAKVRWLVADPHGSRAFDALVAVIHLFRMPAFFLLSGYFTMLLLRKRPARTFLRERLRRIGVPFVATLLTFNLLQVAWLARDHGGGFVAAALAPAWHGGEWVGHLWFLAYLLAYCALAALFVRPLRRFALPEKCPPGLAVAALVALGMAGTLLPRVLWHWQPQLAGWVLLGVFDPMEWLGYLPYFAAGLLLQGQAAAMAEFSTFGAGSLLFGAGAWTALRFDAGHHRLLAALASAALAWTAVRLAFALCRRWLDRPSAGWRYLSDASYTVYLLHHVVVVVAATLLVPSSWSVGAKFALVLCLGMGLPLAAHHYLVLRQPALRYLFNGKRPRDVRDAPAGVALTTSSGPRSP
ncbi:glucans biosynthesis protein MdoC [Pseudoxanthomonas sangjuensis]|uniref:acyltransferase family protein n=1 Tax=Pseudoxanthomonas sangjuensis TaxID=1503750 RepID=UPI001391262F|nr:acyltransferase family protein [Pseudoxanthomonas sangjuensis]KAF1707003.1 hypothetical protein CSC71_13630 [Pseudoxanthomonas sangjuensis]